MTITSTGFLLFLFLAALVFNLAPGRWRSGLIFPVTTLVFLWLVMPTPGGTFTVLGFVAVFWFLLECAHKWPRRSVQTGVLFGALLVFGWIKSYDFLSFLPLSSQIPATIGLSYILIRALQLLIDFFETPAIRPDPVTLFSFLTSWPCLVSGPIQRFQDFQEQLRSMQDFRLNADVLLHSVRRIIKGYFYVIVLADVTEHFWLGLKAVSFEAPHPVALGAAQGAFLFHLYFDFAGYTEIVIGAGYLFGLVLPENFRKPFHAKSFLDFWGRWHMTMSNWFKVYVFNPVLMAFTKHWPAKNAALFLGIAAFFITFFLVGLWHGTTWAFVTCGLLLGFGAGTNHLYRTWLRSYLGRTRFDALCAATPYLAMAAAFTFTYICLSVTPLWMTIEELQKTLALYGLSGLAVAELVLFLMMFAFIPWWRAPGKSTPPAGWKLNLLLGSQLAAIEIYLFLFPSFGSVFFYEQF